MTSRLALRVSACLASLLFAAAAWGVTAVEICGFELGDPSPVLAEDGEVRGIENTKAISSTTVRSGTYALRVNPTTTGVGWARLGKYDSSGGHTFPANVLSTRFYFRYATKPTGTAPNDSEELFRHDATTDGDIRLNSSGNLMLYRGGTTLVATGATVLNADTWYRIEFRTNGSNAWSIKLNGTTEMSGTDAFAAASEVRLGKSTNRNSKTVDWFYDDALASSVDEDIGPGQIVRLAPTANGTYTAWTDGDGDATGDYTDVDDAPGDPAYDSLTSYVLSTTNTNAETVNVTDSSAAGISGTINAVKSITVARRNDASATNIRHRLVSNATAYDLTGVSNANGTWILSASVRSVDPFDSAAWTTADIDGLQVGVEHNQSQARELNFTMACIMVDFQPSTGNAMPEASTIYRRRRVDLDELPNPAPGGPIRGR